MPHPVEDCLTMRALLLLATFMLLPAATPLPTVPVYREFGRWLVACDNTRACIARGFDEITRAQLDLIRPAGESLPTLRLSADTPIDVDAIRLDGKTLPLPAPAWTNKDGAVSTSDAAAVKAFVTAVRDARTITLDAAPPKDEEPRSVPMNGFTAALLLIDAVQGRPGTRTPLIAAQGPDVPPIVPPPAPPLPPAPAWVPPPSLSQAEAARLARQAGRLRSPGFGSCEVRDPPRVYALDQASTLAIRPCAMAAYQGSSVVAVLDRGSGRERPVKLGLPGVPGGVSGAATDGPDMVDPGFDPATGTLSTSSKGRGLADCGSSEAWVWSAGAFRLKSLNYQGQCGGTEPGDWPALFRTR